MPLLPIILLLGSAGAATVGILASEKKRKGNSGKSGKPAGNDSGSRGTADQGGGRECAPLDCANPESDEESPEEWWREQESLSELDYEKSRCYAALAREEDRFLQAVQPFVDDRWDEDDMASSVHYDAAEGDSQSDDEGNDGDDGDMVHLSSRIP